LYDSAQKRLVNTLFSYCFNPQQESFSTQQMNVEINMPRGQSMSSSPNYSRESSTHSNASSMAYADRIQALANSSM